MSGSSLLSCVASRVASSLLTPSRDDPDAFLRHLQLVPRDFLTRFSAPNTILTPYSSSEDQKRTAATGNSEEDASVVSHSSARGRVDEVCPLQTALSFPLGEKGSGNQMHLLELSIFLALLRHPRQSYRNILLWSSLIEKLEELNFYEVMRRSISQLWEVVKQQESELESYNELRLLRISCDVVLFFAEHALRRPSKDVLREFGTLAQEMWEGHAFVGVRRCALVISAFLAEYSDLMPLEALCTHNTSLDSPHLLAVLAGVPALREGTDDKPELLRATLEVVFTTTVYSTPTATYFLDDGVHSAAFSLVRQRFADVLYNLFSRVSADFWDYFTEVALLSALEGIARCAALWDFMPSGVPLLRSHIHNCLVEGNSVYAVSLFNFYISALAYHVGLGVLQEEEGTILDTGASRYVTNGSVPGEVVEDEAAALAHSTERATMMLTDSPLKKTFRLLAMEWGSFRGSEKVLVRSAFCLLHAFMSNYSIYQKELEAMIGANLHSLLHHVATVVLTESVNGEVDLVETFYGTIARFHPMLGNIAYAASNLLLPDLMRGVGVRAESTEIALLQLNLYGTLCESYENAVPLGGLVEAVTHISPGLITCSSLAVEFFVPWLSVVQAALSETPYPLSALLSSAGSTAKLICRLCEGVFVLLRELQSGNLFLCSLPAMPLLEGTIRLLSAAVCEEGHRNTLATCVIATYGENTLSACFVLYCILFSSNASVALVESTAGLLADVVEHSQEKLFTTMRFHTSTELRRMLLSSIHQELRPRTPCNASVNAIRLVSLRYLLRYDPASFYYLILPEEADAEGGLAELPLTSILRDTVRCEELTLLEKAECFELLRSLEDVGLSITEVVDLLPGNKDGPAYLRAAFAAAVINYICGVLLGKMHSEGGRSTKYGDKGGLQQQQQRSPGRPTVLIEKSKLVSENAATICTMLDVGSDALTDCIAFYKATEEELGPANDRVDSLLSVDSLSKRNTRQLVPSRVTQDFTSSLSTAPTNAPLVLSVQASNGSIKVKPMLLGDSFLLWEQEEGVILLNRMASALEAVTRLTASLEAVAWLTYGEREASSTSIKLLDLSLSGVQMVGSTANPLRGLMWGCFEGWLSLARGAASVHMQASAESVLTPSTMGLNNLFRAFVKLMVSNRESIEVVCQGLGILSAFQPSEAADEGTAIQLFELIAEVLEKHATAPPTSALTKLILGCGAIYTRIGKLAPVRCALSSVESLWSCATHVSHMLPPTEPASTLSDFFDYVMDAVITLILHTGELTVYLSHTRVMALASVLGQFGQAAVYDPVANVYKPQTWHRAWLSVLRLLQAVLVNLEASRFGRSEWLDVVSALAATSPRFQDAVSCFMSRGNVPEAKPFAWEMREMQLCTSIIALLASFGVSTASLTPHVRRCFCHIRRYRIPTMAAVDERVAELLLRTVRDQLSYLLQQSPPPAFSDEGLFVVTIERYRSSPVNASSVSSGASLQRRVLGEEGEVVREELLSLDLLRSFILRELNIIRRGHQDGLSGAKVSYSPEHTPSLYSSFTTSASVDSVAETEPREGASQGIALHIEIVKLALGLFVRYARLHLSTRGLALLDRREISVSLQKLLYALNRLIHDVRRLGSPALTWVVDNVREELKDLAAILQRG
ncbi:uncharacterized protein Tco025E_01771 [Trypanosoma conorhini]|uniref:Nucleoporin n=1 Tax=Trypanosoma conorhini TaxID=83891 RepID=A0A422Q7Q8_9TRYP|nr:uncharacterized protein Tco025E_01771 [Trypanosoma conorhini]RNF25984.1 hypothetical protein Tco025E_01771 [Trypanosoma conorhini]